MCVRPVNVSRRSVRAIVASQPCIVKSFTPINVSRRSVRALVAPHPCVSKNFTPSIEEETMSGSYTINMEAVGLVAASMRNDMEEMKEKVKGDDAMSIFRVPKSLRSVDPDAYTPSTISIGPYHREKPELQAMDRVKREYLQKLLDRNPKVTLDYYLGKVMELESRARKCYSEEILLSKEEFAKMLLLDGCFIVQHLLRVDDRQKDGYQEPKVEDPILHRSFIFFQVEKDILMLENQLPFFVLESLFHLATTKNDDSINLLDLVIYVLGDNCLSDSSMMPGDSTRKPCFLHLLHLLHWSMVPLARTSIPPEEKSLTDLTLCASELETAGMKFGVNNVESDVNFLDVTFQNHFFGGEMLFSPFTVYESQAKLLRNMIALEQCYPRAGSYVTSFAYLMDRLVKKSADIALLKRHGVLTHGVGSDEEAAVFFNNLTTGTVLNMEVDYYWELYKDVERYFGPTGNKWSVKVNRWWAKLMQDYFSNPWAFLSLLAALLIITLTIVQTVFAVKS